MRLGGRTMGEQWQKFKSFIGLNNNEYEYDDSQYDDGQDDDYGTEEIASSKAAPVAAQSEFRPRKVGGQSTMTQRPTAMKVIVIEPKVFEDSENITNQLRDMRPVLINFENTDPHEAARIVDFVSGATFALDGKLEKVGKDIFMCVPVNISIDHNDKANLTDLNPQFSWDQTKA